jgi:hypothetical protein
MEECKTIKIGLEAQKSKTDQSFQTI